MNQDDLIAFEIHVTETARRFQYPITPDIARHMQMRPDIAHWRPFTLRWQALLAVILVIFAILFSVPAVRAQLVGWFRIGVVRIVPATITPIVQTPLTATPVPTGVIVPTATPTTTTTALLAQIGGKTTLADAQKQAGFPIRLPAYPPNLGEPDQVFYQPQADMAILVWLNSANVEQIRLSLYIIGPDSIFIKKIAPEIVQETTVNGQYALWTTGPYLLQIRGEFELQRLVEGHTLIWNEGDLTYRLETDLSLEEAIKIAESLR
jgi:hypothetical protein